MFLTLSFTLRRASTGENNPNNEIQITSDRPVTVEIYWDNGTQSKTVAVSGGAAAE